MWFLPVSIKFLFELGSTLRLQTSLTSDVLQAAQPLLCCAVFDSVTHNRPVSEDISPTILESENCTPIIVLFLKMSQLLVLFLKMVQPLAQSEPQ